MLARASCSIHHLAEYLKLADAEISRSLRMLNELGLVTFRNLKRNQIYALAKDVTLTLHDDGALKIQFQWELNTSILIEICPTGDIDLARD